jgi:hypothetical protein
VDASMLDEVERRPRRRRSAGPTIRIPVEPVGFACGACNCKGSTCAYLSANRDVKGQVGRPRAPSCVPKNTALARRCAVTI